MVSTTQPLLPLDLQNPSEIFEATVKKVQSLLKKIGVDQVCIAVSGGIDSALATAILVRACGPEKVTALLLPFKNQDMQDGQLVLEHLGIPEGNRVTCSITSIVEAAEGTLALQHGTQAQTLVAVRSGNLQARARMMCVFDWAKKLGAVVCGTENRSEHFLGYFTRFGDAASDIEPISHLYKSQVRLLAEAINLPPQLITKPPSAGLWTDQTDEAELGFTYAVADQILWQAESQQLLSHVVERSDTQTCLEALKLPETISPEVAKRVLERVAAMSFKLQVPYSMDALWSQAI